MNWKEEIRHRIHLKTQALKLIRIERDELRHQLGLISLRDFLQKRIKEKFDPDLSLQLDAVQFLIDSRRTRFQETEALNGRN